MSSNFIAEAVAQSNSDMLHRVIGNTFIIEYGIIKDIPGDGVVTVEMSVADTKDSVIITDCVLANIAGSSVALNVKPSVGDKVLVLFPRKFHSDMFRKDKDETIIYPQGEGYNILSGIAILLSQFNADYFNNSIDFTDGKLTLKLAYDSDNEKNLLTFITDENGGFSVSTNNNLVSIDKDGAMNLNLAYDSENSENLLTIVSNKNGNITLTSNKAKIEIDKTKGINITDENGNTIKMENTGVNINGKLLVKKGS